MINERTKHRLFPFYRNQVILPLIGHAGITIIILFIFYSASYMAIGENGIHAILLEHNGQLIHGTDLTCTADEAQDIRQCHIKLDGKLLEIKSDKLDPLQEYQYSWRFTRSVACSASFNGESIQCISHHMTHGWRPTGIKIFSKEVAIAAEQEGNRLNNWRSLFLLTPSEDSYLLPIIPILLLSAIGFVYGLPKLLNQQIIPATTSRPFHVLVYFNLFPCLVVGFFLGFGSPVESVRIVFNILFYVLIGYGLGRLYFMRKLKQQEPSKSRRYLNELKIWLSIGFFTYSYIIIFILSIFPLDFND